MSSAEHASQDFLFVPRSKLWVIGARAVRGVIALVYSIVDVLDKWMRNVLQVLSWAWRYLPSSLLLANNFSSSTKNPRVLSAGCRNNRDGKCFPK